MSWADLHGLAIGFAVLVAILLLVAMIVGGNVPLKHGLARGSLRDLAIALWAVLLPAWFMLETRLFAPLETDSEAIVRFRHAQDTGQIVLTVAGVVVGLVIGRGVGTPAPGAPRRRPATKSKAGQEES
jgi:hypothetical protein